MARHLASLLRVPRFLLFAGTQSISLMGEKLDYMALLAMFAWFSAKGGWETSRAISTIGVVSALPVVLFAPLAGMAVDRWDRRKIMIACDSLRALLVLATPFLMLRTMSMPAVLVLAFLVVLLGVVFNTARMSVIPTLVSEGPGCDPGRLLAANSVMGFGARVATFAGVLAGGFLVEWSGWRSIGITHSWATGFFLDSLTYMVSVGGLLLVCRQMAEVRTGVPEPAVDSVRATAPAGLLLPIRRQLQDAWRLAARTPSVAFAYAAICLLVVVGTGFVVLYVPLIQGSAAAKNLAGSGGALLGNGTTGVGLSFAAGAVGLLLSSLGYGAVGHRARKHRVVLGSLGVLGACAIGLALARSFAVVAAVAFIAGLAISPVYIATDTLIHESVPTGSRGRAFSNREWVMYLSFAACAFTYGQLVKFVANRDLLLVLGALVTAASAVGLFVVRGRKIG